VRTFGIYLPLDPVLSGEDPKGSAVRKPRGTPLIGCEHGEDGVKGRHLQERFADATVLVPLSYDSWSELVGGTSAEFRHVAAEA
jgi:hypothetical protein